MTDMLESEKYRIPLFDGKNYNWKFRMEVLLDEKDLSECLTERNYIVHAVHPNATSEQKLEIEERLQATIKAEKRCKCLIIQRIADSHLENVKDKWESKSV